MSRQSLVSILVSGVVLVALLIPFAGCSSKSNTATSSSPDVISTQSSSPGSTEPAVGGGSVINSDSKVLAEIKSITEQDTGYPWVVEILITSSEAVDALPNPVADKTGQVVTIQTDQYMGIYKAGDKINGRIKLVGDVPKPGTTLYMTSISRQ